MTGEREQAAAAVQLVSGSATTADELAAFARERLARFEIPSDWQLSSTPLPITDVGKIDKAAVRDTWGRAEDVARKQRS